MAQPKTTLNKSVKLSYLIPYALLALVAVAALAALVGWQLHGNYNDQVNKAVHAQLELSKQ